MSKNNHLFAIGDKVYISHKAKKKEYEKILKAEIISIIIKEFDDKNTIIGKINNQKIWIEAKYLLPYAEDIQSIVNKM